LFSLVLVFLLSIGEFSVPNFLRFPVLPVVSFTEFSASYNFGAATAAASPLAAIALFGVLVETAFLKERVYAYRGIGDALRAPLKRWKVISVCTVATICVVLVVAPLAALLADAFSGAALGEAVRRAGGSVVRSITYSALAGTILTGLGFLIGYFMRHYPFEILGPLTLGIFAIPGTVLSIGLIRLWNTPHTWLIYTTPALLMLGYAAQYSAVTARVAVSGLLLVPASLDEAARLSGASWGTRLYRIWIPLSKRALVCAWLAGYILCLRDVPLALVTAPPGQDLLPGRILTLMANGSPSLIAALCLIMIVAALFPLIVLSRLIQLQGIAR
jgi:iron(III) transport system permease protein